jgi:hypothetical protein
MTCLEDISSALNNFPDMYGNTKDRLLLEILYHLLLDPKEPKPKLSVRNVRSI